MKSLLLSVIWTHVRVVGTHKSQFWHVFFFPSDFWDGEPLEWCSHRGTSEHLTHMLHYKVAGTCRPKKSRLLSHFFLARWFVAQPRNTNCTHFTRFWSCLMLKCTSWSVLVSSMKLPRKKRLYISHFNGTADATASSKSQTTSKCVSHIRSMNEMQSTQQTMCVTLADRKSRCNKRRHLAAATTATALISFLLLFIAFSWMFYNFLMCTDGKCMNGCY